MLKSIEQNVNEEWEGTEDHKSEAGQGVIRIVFCLTNTHLLDV